MRASRALMVAASIATLVGFSLAIGAPQHPPASGEPTAQVIREQEPQPRPHGQPVAVDPSVITVDDGDTVSIRRGTNDVETVGILGIDTPETRHDEHSIA
jgi:endonuclease YncB( thermonuclease family)